MAQLKHSSFAVIVHGKGKERKYLVGKRSKKANNPGQWGFFGGTNDPGEQPHSAVVREVYEETNHFAKNGMKPLGTHKTPDKHLHYFLHRADNQFKPKLDKKETATHKWVSRKELRKLPLHASVQHYLNHVLPKNLAKQRKAKLLTAKTITLDHPEGTYSLHGVHYNQENGLGQVPDNQEVNYKGFAVHMKPSQFKKLAAARNFDHESSIKHIETQIRNGKPIGSPFLSIKFDPKHKKPAQIMNHKGRTRMEAIHRVHGDVPVLVHIFPTGGAKARHISVAHIQSFQHKAVPEKTKRAIKGPHFNDQIFHQDKWHDVNDMQHTVKTEAAVKFNWKRHVKLGEPLENGNTYVMHLKSGYPIGSIGQYGDKWKSHTGTRGYEHDSKEAAIHNLIKRAHITQFGKIKQIKVESTMQDNSVLITLARKFAPEQREQLAKKGDALPDGSFPITSPKDLKNAIKAVGRAKNPAQAKRYVIRKAKEIGLQKSLPEDWRVTASVQDEDFQVEALFGLGKAAKELYHSYHYLNHRKSAARAAKKVVYHAQQARSALAKGNEKLATKHQTAQDAHLANYMNNSKAMRYHKTKFTEAKTGIKHTTVRIEPKLPSKTGGNRVEPQLPGKIKPNKPQRALHDEVMQPEHSQPTSPPSAEQQAVTKLSGGPKNKKSKTIKTEPPQPATVKKTADDLAKTHLAELKKHQQLKAKHTKILTGIKTAMQEPGIAKDRLNKLQSKHTEHFKLLRSINSGIKHHTGELKQMGIKPPLPKVKTAELPMENPLEAPPKLPAGLKKTKTIKPITVAPKRGKLRSTPTNNIAKPRRTRTAA